MNERPILFSGPMVRAILEGKKTQTRRVARCLLPGDKNYIHAASTDEWAKKRIQQCPYGVPGDRLWVRETFRDPDSLEFFLYKADENTGNWPDCINPDNLHWTPSIFMPRRHSRITLEITDVRVQRVQDISEEDAIAEGITPDHAKHTSEFRDLWDSINAKRGHGWEKNDWVWVITFKQVSQ